ncbi:MAG TPA: GtrA family protein [Anaerolineales bacterium]
MTQVQPRANREFTRFYRFSIVGIIGAGVDFGTFNLLTIVTGMPSVLASVLSFIAAVLSNFTWNRYWTYADSRSKHLLHQLGQYAAVNLVGLAIRTPIFALSERPAGELAGQMLSQLSRTGLAPAIAGLDPLVLGRNMALALAIIVVLVWNFGVNRIWTYSDVQ